MSVAVSYSPPGTDRISKRNFDALSDFIYGYSGIKMPAGKQVMLEGRLRRRLRAAEVDTFDEYCDFLFREGGLETEAVYLIDAVTTNKTDFFREPKHFDYMTQAVLPSLVAQGHRRLRVWSCACSTGAEPYTLAMVIAEFLACRLDMDYSILATDLSTEVLETARKGIYSLDVIAPVPPPMKKKYVMTAKHPERAEVRIIPSLRSHVGFGRLNLMDASYSVGNPMHIIFCRNVLIYFDKPTQEQVLARLCDRLETGGYLFIGHSETLTGTVLPVRQVANTVFQKV